MCEMAVKKVEDERENVLLRDMLWMESNRIEVANLGKEHPYEMSPLGL